MRLTRSAFTLVEIIIAVAIAGVAGSAITLTLVRQQRFFSSAASILDVRSQLRDGADVLVGDLRGAAVARFGIRAVEDSMIEFYATIATSVACAAPSGATIALPPQVLSRGNSLTSILFVPDTADVALLYGIPSGVPDSGRWETQRIASFTSRSVASTCPSSSGFTTAADGAAGTAAYLLVLAASPSPAVRKGAPIVFVRRVRYSIYRSSDGEWYLGYRRCNAGSSVCSAIQPVSGPYRPYSRSPGSSGLSFRYFDGVGLEVPSPTGNVAQIDVILRGQTSRAASLDGDLRRIYRDSVVLTVSPRNRR